MSDQVTIVQEFCDGMVHRDPESLRRFVADDAVYQNCGMPAAAGVEAIVENLATQFAAYPDSYEYVVKNIAGDGDVVLTERLDLIRGPDGTVHGVPVMGTFVLRAGRIVRWTDYWDTNLPGRMKRGEDVSALVPASY
jgi:limonene-1,2-epoxide hydrolase